MTTLADRIADFETQANQLLDLPQQIADTAQARIDQIGTYYQQRLQTMKVTAYVHQQIGDDTTDGSENAPLKSIDEALRRTPPGGLCEIRLAANYHIDTIIDVERRNVLLDAATGANPEITLSGRSQVINNTEYRGSHGFNLLYSAGIVFSNLTVSIPPLAAPYDALPLHDQLGGIVQTTYSKYFWAQYVQFRYCTINLPASPLVPLLSNWKGTMQLAMHGIILPDSPLQGRLFAGVTDSNGTDPNTIPWLTTNLTSV